MVEDKIHIASDMNCLKISEKRMLEHCLEERLSLLTHYFQVKAHEDRLSIFNTLHGLLFEEQLQQPLCCKDDKNPIRRRVSLFKREPADLVDEIRQILNSDFKTLECLMIINNPRIPSEIRSAEQFKLAQEIFKEYAKDELRSKLANIKISLKLNEPRVHSPSVFNPTP
jgi:hypothetical protein